MKQVLQNLRSGRTEAASVPAPLCRAGCLLVRNTRTLISAGTERMLVEFSKASLVAKARSQPDKVRQVLDKIKTDGLTATLEAVFRRLDEPLPLGYCAAGVVEAVGEGVRGFSPGDRVATNASHAELACVPVNLCARIGEEVTDEQAAFTVPGAVALQGIRLLAPALGERFVVYGLGVIGLIGVQLLRASGCDVLGVDLRDDRLELARAWGAAAVNPNAASPLDRANAWTRNSGTDGVLITATAQTDEIVHNAARMCRKRGRIVLVGAVGLNLRRSDFYEKELTFQVSCSYGPGRHDEKYEQGGHDYPFGFVRWTEQRNFQAVLEAMRTRRLVVDDMVTHRFGIDAAADAYRKITDDPSALGVILEYSDAPAAAPSVQVRRPDAAGAGTAVVGVIGAGNYSRATLMPALRRTRAAIAYVADLQGAAARHLADKYRAEQAVTDYQLILDDPRVDAVIVAVRHDLHARLICEALSAGKHVFVEKPLATDAADLARVLAAADKAPDRLVMVGFNRRFSPHTVRLRELLAERSQPLCMTVTVNAGELPADHWTHDPAVGGGRIVGEACHFIDLMVHLAGAEVRTVAATMAGPGPAVREDKMSISIGLADGSVAAVNYFANGPRDYPKETLEVFSDGRVLKLDNFRRLRGWGFAGFTKFKTRRQDKGHRAELAAFVDRVAGGGGPLITLDELANVTRATFAAMESAKTARTITL